MRMAGRPLSSLMKRCHAVLLSVACTAALAAAGMVGEPPLASAAAASERQPDSSLRLISQSQYVNTIHQIFGADIKIGVRFAPVKRVDGLLALGSTTAVLTPGALDPLDVTARSVAAQIVDREHRDLLVPCRPADPAKADAGCARQFLGETGRLLFRRALTRPELDEAVTVAGRSVGPGRDFYSGLSQALSGMLVSPQMLYIRESDERDPGRPGQVRLDGYSKAARLSFLLWDTAPDDQLLAAAEDGSIHSAAGLQRQVDRLIASPLYRDGVRAFFNDFLVLETFDNLSKDSTIYPAFSLKAVEEAREQTLRTVVDHLITQHGDYRDLFTSRRTFLSSELATVYRLPVNLGPVGWTPHQFPEGDPRAGLLSQAGFLAQFAHPGRSSPTRRGRAIREILMCQPVPDPPPNVDFSNFEDPKSGLKTARERLTAHNENPVCAGCHKITDPIGLALEKFDGASQFRQLENGVAIDTHGSLDGIDYSDAAGLGRALRDNESVKACIVDRLYAYARGRPTAQADETLTEGFRARFEQSGYRFDHMLRTMILDASFFARRQSPLGPATVRVASKGVTNAHQE